MLLSETAALLAARLPPPEHSGGEVERVTREVLNRPEFREPKPSLLVRAREWVLDQFGRLLANLFQGGRGSIIGWALLALVVALVVYLVVRFARGVTRDPELAAAGPTGTRRTATDWRAEAAAHEAKGEWRQALRCRYRALVADLAARGLVDEIPGRTAGEYRVEVARNVPAASADFAGATELFELAWYGNRPTGEPEADRFRDLADRVLVGAGR